MNGTDRRGGRGSLLAALPLVALLSACGGGGGGGRVSQLPPAPAPTPAPTPTPTPTPTPAVNYDTAEYRASVGPVSASALTAYQRGATGRGIAVGVIDTGLDLTSQEFAGRVSSASTSTAGNGGYDDEDGHGTAVAFTVAGRRNDAGTHGIAFDSTIIALRTDTPGSCAGDAGNVDESGCSHSGSAIASAIDVAREAGARVINISLGGSAPGTATLQAMSRATQAGIIIVISAGNDGDTAQGANPDPFTNPANDPSISRGLIVIAGSVGTTDTISSFSNRAGTGAQNYLAAVGEQVRAPCNDTQVCLWSGTSFSAPQIAGAAALLAQAFPNLTGAQIVDLLYRSARDAGATGTDGIYGRGILDLSRAFQPVGSTSVAGTAAAVSMIANGTLSAPMGDATTRGGAGAVILDGYDRAFAVDLAATLARSAPAPRLLQALRSDRRHLGAGLGGTTIAMTIAPGLGATQAEQLFLHQRDALRARALAGSITGRLGDNASFTIAASEGGDALVARLSGQRDPAFLVARDPIAGAGFDLDPAMAGAVRHRFGSWGLTAAVDQGAVLFRDPVPDTPANGWQREAYRRAMLALDRRIGAVDTSLALTRLDERETVLGARFAGSLGASAISYFVDLSARLDAGDGWSVGAALRQGWTRVGMAGALQGGGRLRTDAFALDVVRDGLWVPGDSMGMRVAQPMRVAAGGIDLTLPGSWDYATASAGDWRSQRINLAPRGRELDFEWRYSRPLGLASADLNLFLRRDPGNFASVSDDVGIAARVLMPF